MLISQRFVTALCIGSVAMATTFARGEEATTGASSRPPVPPPFEARIAASHLFESDLDGTDASVSRSAVLGDFNYRLPPINQKLILTLSVSGGELFYNFNGPTTLAPGDAQPWKDITLASLGGSALYFFNPKWTGFAAVNVSYAGENGADFGESITGGVVGGAVYKVSDDLSIGGVVLVQTRLEDNVIVIPFPTVKWKLPFDDARRFTLNVGGSETGSVVGAGASLDFAASNALTLSLAVTGFGIGGDFRLDKNGPIPGGVGRDFTVPLVLAVKWQANPSVSVGGFAGVTLFGNVEALNSNGDKIIDRDVDPALTVGGSVTVRF